jgi:hypothetical protein
MQLVGEKQVPDQTTLQSLMTGLNATTSRPTTSQTPISTPTTPLNSPAFQAEYQHRAAWKAGLISAFNALALTLSARLTLLLSVVGAFFLAYLALQAAGPYQLGALGIYVVVVVVPLIWLAARQ